MLRCNVHDAHGGRADKLSENYGGQAMDDPARVQAYRAGKAVLSSLGAVHKHGFYPHVVENLVEEEYQAHFRRRVDPIIE